MEKLFKNFTLFMFELRFLMYGFIIGNLLTTIGTAGLLFVIIAVLSAPIVVWLDAKYIRPLRKNIV